MPTATPNAIYSTPKPYYDHLLATYPHSQLQASGEYVGLPDGQMGNSEVGHLNIGGGRIVYQDLVKINKAIASGSIYDNPEIKEAFGYCARTGKAMHFMGLTSAGGVCYEQLAMANTFEFPQLEKSGAIRLDGCPLLRSIVLPKLTAAASFSVEECPAVVETNFATLERVDGDICLRTLPHGLRI